MITGLRASPRHGVSEVFFKFFCYSPVIVIDPSKKHPFRSGGSSSFFLQRHHKGNRGIPVTPDSAHAGFSKT